MFFELGSIRPNNKQALLRGYNNCVIGVNRVRSVNSRKMNSNICTGLAGHSKQNKEQRENVFWEIPGHVFRRTKLVHIIGSHKVLCKINVKARTFNLHLMFIKMTIEDLRDTCLSLPGVGESIKWENHLCFTVGEKIFLILNPDGVPASGSFKTNPELFDTLKSKPGLSPAPYPAKHRWIHFHNIDRFTKKQWKEHITTAYTLILEKLPAKTRKQIQAL